MRLPSFAAASLALVLALAALPAIGQPGAVFKCQGPGGKTTFSDAPCPSEQKQETLKAAPPAGTVNFDAACKAAAQRTSLSSTVIEACSFMRTCDETKDPAFCKVYCRDFSDSMLPGLRFGPASPACIAHMKRARGSNWVQTQEIEPPNGSSKHDMLRYSCIDASGRAQRSERWVLCEPGTRNCTSPTPTNGVLGPFTALDGLLTRMCRSSPTGAG
jgi:hypothetical protein